MYSLHPIANTQSCLTLCDPMDCSPPGSSIHRIFQVRVLEWVAISFSKILEILQVVFKWLRATQSNAIKFKDSQIVSVVISRCYHMFQSIIPFKEDIPLCPGILSRWFLRGWAGSFFQVYLCRTHHVGLLSSPFCGLWAWLYLLLAFDFMFPYFSEPQRLG